ncbi:MAG: hypothetical protein Q9168_004145 [Polycauliona sp. 1 TL-2023]
MEPVEESRLPQVSITWSLKPAIHSFSSNVAPTLEIALTNHDTRPITIYNEFLIPSTILAEGHFDIFDYTTNEQVDQIKTRFCDFPPPSKVHVPLREQLFHTLHPEEPTIFTTAFGRTKTPPRPKHKGENARGQSRGVDGLEIGHHYGLRPGKGWGFIRWWGYGEKDQVINPNGIKLDGRELAYKSKKTPHPGIRVDIDELPELAFECIE